MVWPLLLKQKLMLKFRDLSIYPTKSEYWRNIITRASCWVLFGLFIDLQDGDFQRTTRCYVSAAITVHNLCWEKVKQIHRPWIAVQSFVFSWIRTRQVVIITILLFQLLNQMSYIYVFGMSVHFTAQSYETTIGGNQNLFFSGQIWTLLHGSLGVIYRLTSPQIQPSAIIWWNSVCPWN
jgi:hypothetical protein